MSGTPLKNEAYDNDNDMINPVIIVYLGELHDVLIKFMKLFQNPNL